MTTMCRFLRLPAQHLRGTPPRAVDAVGIRRAACGVLAMWAAACSDPSVARPSLTAADHERAAREHLDIAQKEAALFDPTQRPSIPCPTIGLSIGSNCVRQTTNPTDVHLEVAEGERRHAEEHRAAASALIHDEDEACQGLTLEDREQGPFLRWPRPFSAQPLVDYSEGGVFYGAVVEFPGDSPDADRLQSLVACHRARLLGRGITTPGHECALDDKAATSLVIATSRGTLLQLRSLDPEAGRRVWQRARRAATASHSRSTKQGPEMILRAANARWARHLQVPRRRLRCGRRSS